MAAKPRYDRAMMPVTRNALRGAILAAAFVAMLGGPAYPQGKSQDSAADEAKRYEAAKKAKELEAQEKAYRSAIDVIPSKQIPLDPWGNVRPNAAPPPKTAR
jgi:hypothetical protein